MECQRYPLSRLQQQQRQSVHPGQLQLRLLGVAAGGGQGAAARPRRSGGQGGGGGVLEAAQYTGTGVHGGSQRLENEKIFKKLLQLLSDVVLLSIDVEYFQILLIHISTIQIILAKCSSPAPAFYTPTPLSVCRTFTAANFLFPFLL